MTEFYQKFITEERQNSGTFYITGTSDQLKQSSVLTEIFDYNLLIF